MIRNPQSACALSALVAALALSGCNAPPSPTAPTGESATAAASTPPGPSEAEQAAALAAREAEVARREAELAAREAADKAEAAAAASAAAKRAAAKPAAARPSAPKPAETAVVAGNGSAKPSISPPVAPPAPPAPPAPLIVPAGTPISIELTNELSTRTARVGDPVEARVATAVVVGGRTAIPAGTRVLGTVSEVISGSSRIGGTPTLGLRFDGIELLPGKTLGISGSLHEAGKSDTARDTAKIAGGALAGAIIGKQVGDNKGRLIGGLLGGAAGLAAAKKTGTEVVLPVGTGATVVLDAALTVPGT